MPCHHQIAHARKRSACERALHETGKKRLLLDQRPLYQALTVSPDLAVKHEVTTVQKTELERIQLAFKSEDARRLAVGFESTFALHEHAACAIGIFIFHCRLVGGEADLFTHRALLQRLIRSLWLFILFERSVR